MAGSQTVWGIDVGKCALKALKLRIGADKAVEVIAADYIEHAKIMTQADADADALWSAALEKFLGRNDISNDQVAISVPGEHTLARFSKLPPVEKKKIPDIVRYEADQQIPFDMDEVVWDYQVFQAPDSPEVEVGIFAIKRDLIRDHLRHFDTGDIEPAVVQAAPLAVYNAMQYDGSLAAGAMVLVDIGTENTNLLVATEDTLWTRTIKFGGNAFTDALVKNFKLSFSKAETLKRTAGTSKYARQIFQAMRPVFADLVQELQRSIGFYTATHRDVELDKIIGLGAAFKLPGLKKYVQQNLQLDLDRLEQFSKIKIPATAEGGDDQAGSFAVAYGLALQGLGLGKLNSSLLPPEIVRQVVWRKKRVFFAASAACLVAAAGVIWFRGITDKGTLEANKGAGMVRVDYEQAVSIIKQGPASNLKPRQHGQTILAAAKVIKSKYNELKNQGTLETQRVKSVVELQTDRGLWLKILDTIHAALPAPSDAVLTAATAEEYVQAIRSIPRDQRKQIIVESLTSEYLANVDEREIPDSWGANIDEKKPDAADMPRPGFVITMRCRTPNANGGLFIADSFAHPLIRSTRKQGLGFYVNRVGVVGASQTKTSGSSSGGRRGSSGSGRGSRGGRRGRSGRGGGGGGGTVRSAPRDETLDPLTGEPVGDKVVFDVVFDLVLGDLPEENDAARG